MIGKVLDRLEVLGLSDDTLIVYASDHGDHVGERGLWWKHTFFDESAKVPMILSHSSLTPHVRDEVVRLIDLSATMLDAMGANPLPDADGRSFWPLLNGGAQDWQNITFSEYCTDAVPAWTGGRAVQQRMLREGDWKLHYYHGEPARLYDLSSDPQERVDLAEVPEHAARYASMLARVLEDWDPDAIAKRMGKRRANKDIVALWARQTDPKSTHLWALEPDMNRLDDA